MPRVHFTRHLKRFFPDLEESFETEGKSVAELVRAVDRRHPGLGAYLVDERGSLRNPVLVFIGGDQIEDRAALTDPVGERDEVHFLQSLSGG
ncbi:MAG: MoaD/ThiS family protein [Candidatus Eisenbacteria bacterium]